MPEGAIVDEMLELIHFERSADRALLAHHQRCANRTGGSLENIDFFCCCCCVFIYLSWI